MKKIRTCIFLSGLACAIAAVAPAHADKPDWAGNGHGKGRGDAHDYGSRNDKGERGDHGDRHDGGDVNISIGAYFGGSQRTAAYDYYGPEFRAGHCPPGLAKKHNGCMPPGQAKQWALGRPLPSTVTYYAVPSVLVARLGPPPAGHRYVRVASDILLIAVGTGMVVDAIEDLGAH